jgi:hypothetical protein
MRERRMVYRRSLLGNVSQSAARRLPHSSLEETEASACRLVLSDAVD